MGKTTTSNTIKRLSNILDQLFVDASKTDKENTNRKSHRLIENNNLFSATLFSTQSDRFFPYVTEIARNLKEFTQLTDNTTAKNKVFIHQLSKELLQKIEHQVLAIMNALQANTTMHQAAKLNQNAKSKHRLKAMQQNKYKNIAKKVMLSSHQLYDKLTEHHEFERRLLAMIFEKEQQLAQCNDTNKTKLSMETLALHQRLGRCRKAISGIEREIEQAEKIK